MYDFAAEVSCVEQSSLTAITTTSPVFAFPSQLMSFALALVSPYMSNAPENRVLSVVPSRITQLKPREGEGSSWAPPRMADAVFPSRNPADITDRNMDDAQLEEVGAGVGATDGDSVVGVIHTVLDIEP
jgi:hypothetical protein